MATNLISSVMQFLTPDVVAKIAPALGIDPEVAKKVVSAGVPAILASFAGVAASPAGAQELADALTRQQPDTLAQVSSAIGGPEQKAVADTGAGLLSALLGGSGLNALTSAMSTFSGINQTAGKSMLGLLAPFVVGVLGQQQRSDNLNASGLANLLSSQKDQITAAMPPGLSNVLSARGLLDGFDASLRRGADTATTAADRAVDAMGGAASGASRAAYATARKPMAASWLYLIPAALVLAGLGWYFLGDHGQQVAQQSRPATTATTESASGQAATPDAAALSADLTTSVETVRSTLQGITDPASARAALPKLQQATERLDRINGLASQLPPNSRKNLASVVGASMPTLNRLCDKALSSPQIAGLAKPTIDALRAKLELLAQA